MVGAGFGSIQNNIALKLGAHISGHDVGFGSIQNNIALKLVSCLTSPSSKFW